jgi:hypothetical protein
MQGDEFHFGKTPFDIAIEFASSIWRWIWLGPVTSNGQWTEFT